MSERKRLLPRKAKEWLKMVFWRVSEDGMVSKGAKRVELTQQVNRKLDCKGAMELQRWIRVKQDNCKQNKNDKKEKMEETRK